jgi:hypothetical protein
MRRSSLCLAIALSIILSCHQSPPPAPPPKVAPSDAGDSKPADGLDSVSEQEPNDGPDAAQLLVRPTRVTASLHPVQPATRPDEDWFLIKPERVPADAQVTISGFDGGRLVVELYDRDRDKILALSTQPGHSLAMPTVRVRDAMLIRLSSPNGGAGPYQLALRLSEPDPNAEAEPNDRPADATPLALDQVMHASLGTGQDQDWFRVELNPNGGHGPPDAGLAASVPGAVQGGAVPAQDPRAGDAATTPIAPPPPATGSGGRGPGSGLGSAGVAGSSSEQVAALQPLEAPDALLRVSVSAIPGVRTQLAIFDQNQAPVATLRASKIGAEIDERDLALRPETTAVYLVITGSPHDTRGPEPAAYQITVHREPAPADFEVEPNDTPSQATRIGTHRAGYLSPAGDVDYYLLHLGEASVVHAVLSPLDHVDTELAVVDEENGKDHLILRVNEGGAKEPEVIPALVLPAGDHLLRVQTAAHQVGDKWVRDQANADDPYSLTLSVSPDQGSIEREPNDKPDLATPIKIGQTLSGYAYPPKDIDIFLLDLSAQPVATGIIIRLIGALRVPLALELHGAPQGAKLGTLLNTSDLGKPGASEEIRAKLDPGIYQIVVRPRPISRAPGQPLADPDSPYQLSIQSE